MENQHLRAELRDRINTFLALGALPFASLLILDALKAGIGHTDLIVALDWIAKIALSLVVVWCIVLIVRKLRTGSGSDLSGDDSYTTSAILKAAATSWVVTFVLLYQFFDRLFQEGHFMGIVELPLAHSGEIIAAFMLIVFSLTYFALNLSARWSEAREAGV